MGGTDFLGKGRAELEADMVLWAVACPIPDLCVACGGRNAGRWRRVRSLCSPRCKSSGHERARLNLERRDFVSGHIALLVVLHVPRTRHGSSTAPIETPKRVLPPAWRADGLTLPDDG